MDKALHVFCNTFFGYRSLHSPGVWAHSPARSHKLLPVRMQKREEYYLVVMKQMMSCLWTVRMQKVGLYNIEQALTKQHLGLFWHKAFSDEIPQMAEQKEERPPINRTQPESYLSSLRSQEQQKEEALLAHQLRSYVARVVRAAAKGG